MIIILNLLAAIVKKKFFVITNIAIYSYNMMSDHVIMYLEYRTSMDTEIWVVLQSDEPDVITFLI